MFSLQFIRGLRGLGILEAENKGTDIHISAPALKPSKLTEKFTAESSASIQKHVQKARGYSTLRFKGLKITSNAQMNKKLHKQICNLDDQSVLQ